MLLLFDEFSKICSICWNPSNGWSTQNVLLENRSDFTIFHTLRQLLNFRNFKCKIEVVQELRIFVTFYMKFMLIRSKSLGVTRSGLCIIKKNSLVSQIRIQGEFWNEKAECFIEWSWSIKYWKGKTIKALWSFFMEMSKCTEWFRNQKGKKVKLVFKRVWALSFRQI